MSGVEAYVSSEATAAVSHAVEGFDQIQYWLSASRDDFALAKFRESLPQSLRDSEDMTVLIAPSDSKHGQYHAYFAWSIAKEDVEFTIEYHSGTGADDLEDGDLEAVEKGPPAEHLMSWLGQFFSSKTTRCHAHARYLYSTETRQSAFRLSLLDSLPGDATLYGVALSLPDKPNGITSVRLTKARSDWYAELVGDLEIAFASFSPLSDAQTLLGVLEMFLVRSSK